MASRWFVVQAVVLGLCLVATNVAIRYLARNTDARKAIREIERGAGATDVFVGNSVVRQAVRTDAYEAAAPGRKAINIAVHGITTVEEDLLLRRALQLKPARIFVGFFETALTDPPRGGWDELSDRRAMAYYLYPEIASEFYFPNDSVAAIAMRVVGQIPMLYERHRIWFVVERLRARLAAIGLPRKVDSTPFYRRPPADWHFARAAECQREFRETIARSADLSPPVLDMLSLANESGATIYFFEAPMSSLHRRLIFDTPAGKAYRDYLSRLVVANGGVYVKSMDWIDNEHFGDWIHIDIPGGRKFSQKLAAIARPIGLGK